MKELLKPDGDLMTDSKIEWTERSDWNPVRGCTRVSPGCGGPGPHGGCYAERIAARFSDPGQPFHGIAERTSSGPRWTGKVQLVEDRLMLPLRWRNPARIFVNSMFDLFHESIPEKWIDRIFAVMALAPRHTFQVLTKRAERMREYLTEGDSSYCTQDAIQAEMWTISNRRTDHFYGGWPLANVWLGVSVEDQQRAEDRIPHLLATPAAKRFISAEPLLGPVQLRHLLRCGGCPGCGSFDCGNHGLSWVIAGGESGARSRPMHPSWPMSLRDQCAFANIPFFFKQWGEWAPSADGDGDTLLASDGRQGWFMMDTDQPACLNRVGKKRAGRLLDGVEHNEMPA